MKRICITYHMSIDHSRPSDSYPHNIEVAENCITIPMLDEMADDILENQSNSRYLMSHTGQRNVYDALLILALLQGYNNAEFITAESAE